MAQEEKSADEIGKKLDLADSWLTKFGNILKKHWGKLIFILFGFCVYWILTQPVETEDPQYDEYYYQEPSYDDQGDQYDEQDYQYEDQYVDSTE